MYFSLLKAFMRTQEISGHHMKINMEALFRCQKGVSIMFTNTPIQPVNQTWINQ